MNKLGLVLDIVQAKINEKKIKSPAACRGVFYNTPQLAAGTKMRWGF
jgi:hypothetical protein